MFPIPVQMQNLHIGRIRLVVAGLLLALVLTASGQQRQESVFRTITPMGGDTVQLMPAKARLQILASMESKELEGVRQIRDGEDEFLRGPDGSAFKWYPKDLKFRFSIGSSLVAIEKNPIHFETADAVNDFQATLRFQLKIFTGLKSEVLTPVETKMIGMPASVPYDQRIYSVRFQLPNELPARERMRLEVLDRYGNLVTKFQVQLL
ncbi:MAG TPA: hypothetical protein VM056_03635 [Terriglobales bacterium]|nr:hypothetical protein [Terriglobales bacterium]